MRTDDGCEQWTDVSGNGPPLVLCHGGPGLWDMFGELAAELADVRTVWRWDQRGGGRSGGPGRYAVDRFVADLDALVTAAGALPDVIRVALPDVGHIPWLEAPEPSYPALREFL